MKKKTILFYFFALLLNTSFSETGNRDSLVDFVLNKEFVITSYGGPPSLLKYFISKRQMREILKKSEFVSDSVSIIFQISQSGSRKYTEYYYLSNLGNKKRQILNGGFISRTGIISNHKRISFQKHFVEEKKLNDFLKNTYSGTPMIVFFNFYKTADNFEFLKTITI